MNVKRYYRQYNELIKKHERLSYQIALKGLRGIYKRASEQYLSKPDTPIQLLVTEADTLNILVKIYDSIGIAAASLVANSLPKQKHSSLQIQTKAGGKPRKQYAATPDDSSATHENYWKQEFLRFTQSADCAAKVRGITETTRSQIRTVITNGIRDQYSHKKIAALLLQHADGIDTKKRALLIARTENAVGSNLGAMYGARSSGLVLYKQWIARSGDSRTRDAHVGMIDKAPIPIDDLFDVGGEKMSQPGDSSNGATAKNICNCRCTVAFIPASEVIQIGLTPSKPARKPRVVKPKPDKLPDLFTDVVVNEPVNQYIPVNTVEEAQQWAISNGMAKHVDYSWTKDVKVANEINRVLFNLKDRFNFESLNQIGGKTKGVGTLMSANFQGLNIKHSFWKTNKTIITNYYKVNDSKFVERSLSNAAACKRNYEVSRQYKWLKKASDYEHQAKFNRWTINYSEDQFLESTIHHEFGHVLHDQLLGGINGARALSSARVNKIGYRAMAQELDSEFYLLYSRSKQTGDIYKISAYGSSNHKEYFAETFVMYMAKDPDLPAYMYEFFDRMFTITKLP